MLKKIAVCQDINAIYPSKENKFRPSENYPEYVFKDHISQEKNDVYKLIRESFHMFGLDDENYGTKEWNPLKEYVSPGDKVVLKPNMVMDFNPTGDGTDCLYTQPSIVAAIVDYVLIALKGQGEIVIGDAPMQECNFEKLVNESGYDILIDYYKERFLNTSVKIELKDFRGYKSEIKAGVHHGTENNNTNDGVLVDITEESEFVDYDEEKLERLRINSYNPEVLKKHHNINKHEYLVNKDIMEADVIINIPKPKTHRKAGVTIALKNLVGINVRKEYLPHHCDGDAKSGGDEYNSSNWLKSIKSKLQDRINWEADNKNYKKASALVLLRKFITAFIRLSKDQSWDGSWYGNQTISKTITDLNKILFYADKRGKLTDSIQRKYLIIADMIISGENEGPIEPTEKKAGIVAIGDSALCFDEAISTLMGMDVKKIPTINQVRNSKSNVKIICADDEAYIVSNNPRWNRLRIYEVPVESTMKFIPAEGWIGHIELQN